MLTSRGIDVSRVRVSRSAHVLMPYHVALDKANEARLAGDKVGTTGRGIGPAYGDRAWRIGLRMEDLLDEAVLRARLERVLPDKNLVLASLGAETFEVEPLVAQALAWGRASRALPRGHDLAGPAGARRGRPRPARRRAGHAARPRSRQLSVRDLLEPGGGRRDDRRRDRAAPGRRGHGRHEGLRHASGLRAVPDRARGRDRPGHRAPAATRWGPRPADPGASAGSTRSRCAMPWR